MKKARRMLAVVVALAMFLAFPLALHASAPITVTVDGVVVEFADQEPVMVEGRVLVPVRGVFEKMGFEANWNRATRTATLLSPDFEVVIVLGQSTFTVNGETVTPDVPQQLMNDRVMLPLSAIAEAVGATPSWDGAARVAAIVTGEVPVVDEDVDEDEDIDEDEDVDEDEDIDEDVDEDVDEDEDVDTDEDEDADVDEDEDDEDEDVNPLVGRWYNVFIFVFNADGTGYEYYDGRTWPLNWSVADGILTLHQQLAEDLEFFSDWYYEIEGDTLTLTAVDDAEYDAYRVRVFTRVQ